MRDLPDGMLEALQGSAGDVSMQFNIWYNQQLVFPDVSVSGWSLSWDNTRQVMGQGTFAVLDPDALLIPWGYDDALSVGGGMIQTKFICGGASVDLGFQRITRSEPDEKWRLYEPGGVKFWVAGTHIINIDADDVTTVVGSNRFLTPETPPSGATVFSELARVVNPYMDVIIDPNLTDRSVPSTVVYKDNRLDTVQQLCDAIGADQHTTGGGQLYVYQPNTSSVWTVLGGSHDANLIVAKRSANYSGLYNGVVSRNTLSNGKEIQAVVVQNGGALDWNGPHGHVPYFHQASFATSQSSITADATTMLNTLMGRRTQSMTFTSILHPGIETGDVVTLMMPLYDGGEYPLPGKISSITFSGNGGVNATMDCTVDVQDNDIADISLINSRKKWLA
jgi:hypothetical protein